MQAWFSLSLSLARASNARSWSHTERRRWQRFENQGSCGRNESNGRLHAALINGMFRFLAAAQPKDKPLLALLVRTVGTERRNVVTLTRVTIDPHRSNQKTNTFY